MKKKPLALTHSENLCQEWLTAVLHQTFYKTQTGQQILTFPSLHFVWHKTENDKKAENSKSYAM